MTLIEKVMLIAAILMPVLALTMFLPKIIKTKLANRPKKEKPKKSKKTKPTQPYTLESAPIEVKPEVVQPEREKFSTLPAANDFKAYAERKSKRISPPKRNFAPPNFSDFDGFRPRPINQPKQEKTLREEIKSLSPQLKALIISGALDRKDFDD